MSLRSSKGKKGKLMEGAIRRKDGGSWLRNFQRVLGI